MKKNQKLLYRTGLPRGLYGWLALPVIIVISFWSFGMEFFGALFYGSISAVIYLATNPDFCQISVYEDHVTVSYYRPFNTIHRFGLDEFEAARYQRGELFHALPFLFKPVRLNDYIEFYTNEKKDEKISLNVKCNREEARKCVRLMNHKNTPQAALFAEA